MAVFLSNMDNAIEKDSAIDYFYENLLEEWSLNLTCYNNIIL
jgi:hypothetical protein